MTLLEEVTTKNLLKHKSDVIDAVKTYHRSSDIKVSHIACSFKKSENEIANWFCEAISKGYIQSDDICKEIISKHVKEYEKKYCIKNSSLRDMYRDAFKKRKLALAK